MKILVALKQVPDTETKIKINSEGTALDLSDVKWVTSPYDEYALEEAMRLKESQGATVSVIAVGMIGSEMSFVTRWPSEPTKPSMFRLLKSVRIPSWWPPISRMLFGIADLIFYSSVIKAAVAIMPP